MHVFLLLLLQLCQGVTEHSSQLSLIAPTPHKNVCYRWQTSEDEPSLKLPTGSGGHIAWTDPQQKNVYIFGGCPTIDSLEDCSTDLHRLPLTGGRWINDTLDGEFSEDRRELQIYGECYTSDPESGTIYIFGGARYSTTKPFAFSNSLDIIQPTCENDDSGSESGSESGSDQVESDQSESLCSWSWMHKNTEGDIPKPCQDAALAILNRTLVLFGGFSDDYSGTTHTLGLDTLPLTWAKHVGSHPSARKGHSLTSAGDMLLLFGGTNGPYSFDDLWIFDSTGWSSPQISAESPNSAPSPRAFHTAVVYDQKLIIFGGIDLQRSVYFNDIHIFQIETATWISPSGCASLLTTSLANTHPLGRHRHSMTLLQASSVVIGGFSPNGALPNVDELDLKAVCKDSCGLHGTFDVDTKTCICQGEYTGKFCEIASTCPNNCTYGVCVLKNSYHYCKCHGEYWGIDCSFPPCLSNCSGHGLCRGNENSSYCECFDGYSGSDCSNHQLEQSQDTVQCPSYCSGHGVCKAGKDHSSICDCESAFHGSTCAHQCPMGCSGVQGRCGENGTCECALGFEGIGCSKSVCVLNCSNHGNCIDNRCICTPPYVGSACQYDSSCGGHGQFVDGNCICTEPYLPPDCTKKLVCSNSCNHGQCKLSSTSVASSTLSVLLRAATENDGDNEESVEGECVCDAGYTGSNCDIPLCPGNGTCFNQGFCNNNGTCSCYPGYIGSDCSIESYCPSNCTSELHGLCQPNGLCLCQQPFALPDCATVGCPNSCSNRGTCVNGICHCDNSFSGLDCSLECEGNCSSNGICVEGNCICYPGWKGDNCDTEMQCPFVNGTECSGHGQCFRPTQRCICEPGYSGEYCSNGDGGCSTDSNGVICNNRGVCQGGVCFCNPGYTGSNCENETQCEQDCNGHGFCNGGICQCFPGFSGDLCADASNDTSCPNNCNGNGVCQLGSCHCLSGYRGTDCSILEGFCVNNNCSNQGVCQFNQCNCFPGVSGTHCEKACDDCPTSRGVCLLGQCRCLPGFTGSHCEKEIPCPGGPGLSSCNGHGVCYGGRCACFPGYTGQDCGTRTGPITPCDRSNCSNAGVCAGGQCFCLKGYTGHDCSIELKNNCPLQCNKRGQCYHGECFCAPGFTGAACESKAECSSKCLEHGVCQWGKCWCAAGYTGVDCQDALPEDQRIKQLEDDMDANEKANLANLTSKNCDGSNDCSNHGVCIDGNCICLSGYSGSDCSQVSQGPESSRCGNFCSSHGECLFGKCFCDLGYRGDTCNEVVPCPNDCNGHGICQYGKCYCDLAWKGDSCQEVVKCNPDCGPHGVCFNGNCVCATGYHGKLCNKQSAGASVAVEEALQRQHTIPKSIAAETDTTQTTHESCENWLTRISNVGIGFIASSACFLLIFYFAQRKRQNQKRHASLKPLLGS